MKVNFNDNLDKEQSEEKTNYDINFFYNLDSENKICFDCNGALPTFVSINNGAFLCQFCAENHRKKLNYNISYIHEINSEWDKYLLSFALRGGNSRFKRLCQRFEVPCQSSTQNDDEKVNKYLIKLGEYNRLLLKSEISCEEPPPELYFDVAKDPIDLKVIYFPEFENYHLFKGNLIAQSKGESGSGSVSGNPSVGNKIWEGTKSTLGIMKSTSGFIYNTSKPIVSFLGSAAFSGLKFVGSSVWNYCTSNNETNNGNKETNKGDKGDGNNKNIDIYGYNTPLNGRKDGNIQTQQYPNHNPNIYNNIYNNYNNKNGYNNNNFTPQNRNYLSNSNRFNIFTINPNGISNNNNNINNNKIDKPMKSNSNKNNIQNYYYDINSINKESVNNITFYLNNSNNSLNNTSKMNDGQKSLLLHDNIIVNDKYIKNENILNNNKNNINQNGSSNNNNNVYPSFNDDNGINGDIFNRNVPNIIGEEMNQEKARYPIFQSMNVLDNNAFLPSKFEDKNENENENKNNSPF